MEPTPSEEAEGAGVAARLETVRAKIAAAAEAAGRRADAITLVAVGKTQPETRIAAALAAGQRCFGENYVQEANGRWPALRRDQGDLSLHLIGALQSNKALDAVRLFDVIQTVDRPKLARALAAAMAKAERRPPCLVQVNTGEEAQKAGVAPDELDAFLALCRDELRLDVRGLMAIPPAEDDVAPHAALLTAAARRHELPVVSVGMSGDYETAIAFGATHVRVGSAIFGPRPRKSA